MRAAFLELPSLRRSWYIFSFLIDELGTAVTSDSPWIAGRMPRTAFWVKLPCPSVRSAACASGRKVKAPVAKRGEQIARSCRAISSKPTVDEIAVLWYHRIMADVTVLVIDMMNAYQHPDAELLIPNVAKIVEPLTELIARVRERDDVDLVYVNDNYGDFTAEPSDIVRSALAGERPDLVKPVAPAADCRFLTKVRHSVFYATPLDYLLGRLGTRRVVLIGQVTEQCVLYSALDAYIRHFDVIVAPDAVAHIDAKLGQAALQMMERNMGAELVDAADCLG